MTPPAPAPPPGPEAPAAEGLPARLAPYADALRCPVCAGAFATDAGALRCTSCGRAYPFCGDVPVLVADAGAAHVAHYAADAALFDYFETPGAATAHEERRLHERILRALPAGAGRVLDVGCGRAWVAGALLPRGASVVSLDASEANPQRALDRLPARTHAGVAADALALPFADGVFDVVVAAEITEHVPDPGRFLAELFRVLRPGGRLVVTTPYRERIRYVLCVHCNQRTPLHAHLHSFDETTLPALLAGPGVAERRAEVFSNNALALLRLHPVLGRLPHGLWHRADALASKAVGKPTRLLVAWTKAA